MSNCLACHTLLSPEEGLYHSDCLKAFWQEDRPVLELDYELSQIEELARENVAHRIIVTGVQPNFHWALLKKTIPD